MSPEAFSELVRARHSVRDFRPDPIPTDVMDAILDDARHAPSWSNTRPYCLAVASGEQADRLRAAYAAEFDAALGMYHRKPSAFARAALTGRLPDGDFKTWGRYPDDLRPASASVGKRLYAHVGIARGDRAARDAWNRRNCEFFGAPTAVWVFVHEKLLPFSAHDAGLMLQTLMLSAAAHGLGSCALGARDVAASDRCRVRDSRPLRAGHRAGARLPVRRGRERVPRRAPADPARTRPDGFRPRIWRINGTVPISGQGSGKGRWWRILEPSPLSAAERAGSGGRRTLGRLGP